MVEADKPIFAEELQHFGIVNRVTVNDDMRRAYWADLNDMTLDEFKRASKYLRRHTKWFPKPSEFWAVRRQGWM